MAEIALSFDNGPDPAATPRILEILARRGVTACFFVVGAKAARPDGRALMRDARAGHRIGGYPQKHSVSPRTERSADPGSRATGSGLAGDSGPRLSLRSARGGMEGILPISVGILEFSATG